MKTTLFRQVSPTVYQVGIYTVTKNDTGVELLGQTGRRQIEGPAAQRLWELLSKVREDQSLIKTLGGLL